MDIDTALTLSDLLIRLLAMFLMFWNIIRFMRGETTAFYGLMVIVILVGVQSAMTADDKSREALELLRVMNEPAS